MRAKELMMGDWVIYNGYPCKVYSLQGAYPREGRFNDKPVIDVWVGNGFLSVGENEIKPVSLTAEILEKNGWKYMKESELILAPKSGGFVKYKTDTHFVSISGDGVCRKNIGYFHELQRALRLCGLTELADSMII